MNLVVTSRLNYFFLIGLLTIILFSPAAMGQSIRDVSDAYSYVDQLQDPSPAKWQQALSVLRKHPKLAYLALRDRLEGASASDERWVWVHALQEFGSQDDLSLLLKLYYSANNAWEKQIAENGLLQYYPPVQNRAQLYRINRQLSYQQTEYTLLSPNEPRQVWLSRADREKLRLAIMPGAVRRRWNRLAGTPFSDRTSLLEAFTKNLPPEMWERWKWAFTPAIKYVPRKIRIKGLLTFQMRSTLTRGVLMRLSSVVWNAAAPSQTPNSGWSWLSTSSKRRWQLPVTLVVQENQELVRITVQVEELKGKFFPWSAGITIPVPNIP